MEKRAAKKRLITDTATKFQVKKNIIEKHLMPESTALQIGNIAKAERIYHKSVDNTKIYGELIDLMKEYNIKPAKPFPSFQTTEQPVQFDSLKLSLENSKKTTLTIEELDEVIVREEEWLSNIQSHDNHDCMPKNKKLVIMLSKEKEDLIIEARMAIDTVKAINRLLELYTF
nr:hypothetical protein [uncultured Allomuricauda sp.]